MIGNDAVVNGENNNWEHREPQPLVPDYDYWPHYGEQNKPLRDFTQAQLSTLANATQRMPECGTNLLAGKGTLVITACAYSSLNSYKDKYLNSFTAVSDDIHERNQSNNAPKC